MAILVQPKVDNDREARAPYNFIPLPEKVITLSVADLPDQGVYHSDRHTGFLDCKLTTSTPVYTRAGIKPEDAKEGKESKDYPEFFYLDEKQRPVIPGSSIRGMLRTLVEIITFSKIGAVSQKPLVYRSVGGTTNHDENYRSQMMKSDDTSYKAGEPKSYTPLIRGGYMVKVGSRDWAIRPAKAVNDTTYAHIGIGKFELTALHKLENCLNAYKIYVKIGPYQYQDVKEGFLKVKFAKVLDCSPFSKPGYHPATLALSGRMFSKKSEAVIFEADRNVDLLPLTDDQVDAYILQRSKEQESLLGHEGVLNDGQPVFYILDPKTNCVAFFGHARMFRVPYHYSPNDLVPDYARSTDEPMHPSLVDYAEAMFGYTRKTGKNKKQAYAGRVSCTDAVLDTNQNDIWLSPEAMKPRVLAGPKPTTFQHYLIQPQPNYYPGERNRSETRLMDYDCPLNEDVSIRGHKFYWHKGPVGLDDIRQQGKVKETQVTSIRPVKAGVNFSFKVHFENLTTVELGALIWLLDQSSKDHMRLKIGMGKPLGMGAIAIKSVLYIQNFSECYSRLTQNGKWSNGCHRDDQLALGAHASFSAHMLSELNKDLEPDERLDDFTKSPHIRAFLVALQWPGLEPEWSRYMEIEHPDITARNGKRNEYKERPVLPSAFGVWSKHKKH